MARLWRVNDRNDIFTTGGGRLAIVEGVDAVLQHCEHAINAQLGEMIYAADRGVNTFDSIWDGSPNVPSFEASARLQLERIPNVVNVERFDAQLVGNTLNYQTTIRTTFGVGSFAGSL